MAGLPIGFAFPWVLAALLTLPVIWWFLRLTPPQPQKEPFPPTAILQELEKHEETPAKSPWWLTLLRLLMAALVIFAMAGPTLNPQEQILNGEGPVLIIMDDGWASASKWKTRRNSLLVLVRQARDDERTVMLLSTSGRTGWSGSPIPADEAISLIEAAGNLPARPDHVKTVSRFRTNAGKHKPGDIVWLSDGLSRSGTNSLIAVFGETDAASSIIMPETKSLVVIETIQNEPTKLQGSLKRALTRGVQEFNVIARDLKGVVLARRRVVFEAGKDTVGFFFDEPIELRNEITRVDIDEIKNAGAVQLLDENNQRRLIGLISGEKHDLSQPLLSPLYYISRALEPFSDLRRSDDANIAVSVPQLIERGISALVMADVGLLPDEAVETLDKWISEGGMLIRFAGPRLASSPQGELLPVEIRPGGRSLGGALSWETPKPVAPFEPTSPFYGLSAPREVSVGRQVLALQETGLEAKTWATLEDGTPLVTAEQRGRGWIILFHVSSDATWSNLPLSGTFVEMLRRAVNLSRSTSRGGVKGEAISLQPMQLLDGTGKFVPAGVAAKPLVLSLENTSSVSIENPPGYYGTEDGFTALNLFNDDTGFALLERSALPAGLNTKTYTADVRLDLKPWFLLAAALLLVLDCLAVLWMGGAFGWITRKQASTNSAALIICAFASFMYSTPQSAAQGVTDYSAALRTQLAYVVTGVDQVDRISLAGMRGLTLFLSERTALEPGEPAGLDMSIDELSFYSLIYWPVDPVAELPDAATMARVDAYMKEGGSILFDTRDQISGIFGGTSSSPAARTLQLILSSLDIPPLEPVPSDHVITKSFYLLDRFPGRFEGGDLWIEASQRSQDDETRPARVGDGVSSILITSNDFAGAWAVDENFRPMFPTIPPDPAQRNYAFRVGVNLMMYALTGNYKSDQVHLPALLERLGQ